MLCDELIDQLKKKASNQPIQWNKGGTMLEYIYIYAETTSNPGLLLTRPKKNDGPLTRNRHR